MWIYHKICNLYELSWVKCFDMVWFLQIHWPVRMKKGSVGFKPENLTETDIGSTWRAMEATYDAGKAKAIGVSNFSMKKLNDLLQYARVPPAVNQVECHPQWQQPQLHQFCASHGVHISVSIRSCMYCRNWTHHYILSIQI